MKFHFLIALPLAVQPFLVQAQDAASAESTGLQLEYQSAFEGYKAFSDSEIQNWPKVNQLVHEIGGWRVYAREATQAETDPGAVDAAPSSAGKSPVAGSASHQHGGEK